MYLGSLHYALERHSVPLARALFSRPRLRCCSFSVTRAKVVYTRPPHSFTVNFLHIFRALLPPLLEFVDSSARVLSPDTSARLLCSSISVKVPGKIVKGSLQCVAKSNDRVSNGPSSRTKKRKYCSSSSKNEHSIESRANFPSVTFIDRFYENRASRERLDDSWHVTVQESKIWQCRSPNHPR